MRQGSGVFAWLGVKRPAVATALLAMVLVAGVLTAGTALAKAPGERHCYGQVCVRVFTVAETMAQLGETRILHTSHYDDPSVDPFNRNVFTSNGERFSGDDPSRTASPEYPDGTELLLRNPKTGDVSHVRVNDFGPFWPGRHLDVTRRVAEDMGFAGPGLVDLEVTVVAPPTPDDVRALYRQDRKPVPTGGYLGVHTVAQTAEIARLLISRWRPRIWVADGPSDPTRFVRAPAPVPIESVYVYLDRQTASPRASGAER